MNILEEIKRFFLHGSVLARLIGINVAVFVLINLLGGIFYLMAKPEHYEAMAYALSVPAATELIAQKPWTVITYMFLHMNFFHILFNMIVLYVGGRLFIDFLGKEKLIGTYLLGGIAGAIVYIVSFNIFPVFQDTLPVSIAMGASASVLAIFIAIAVYAPNINIPLLLIGRVKLKYIALFFIIIDLISIHKGNPGGHLAHLGGAMWGFIYISLLKAGLDPAKYVGKFINGIAGIFNRKPRMRVHYEKAAPRPVSDEEYNKHRVVEQEEIDKILDKISKHGYDSLSTKEKELLFKNSKR